MTDYKNIRGKKIKFFTSDLGNDEAEGQIFYQDTDNQFKTVVASAAWSSAANGLTARGSLPGGFGTQTAAVAAGGYTTTDVATTEEYNGNGYSSAEDLNTARYGLGGAGTLTAGVVFAGHENPPDNSGKTEEYDGTDWSEQNDMNTGRRNPGGFGIQTAAVACGGYNAPNAVNNSEEYNGTSWSEGNNLNVARVSNAACGIESAGLTFGGFTGGPPYPRSDKTEEYDYSKKCIIRFWYSNTCYSCRRFFS